LLALASSLRLTLLAFTAVRPLDTLRPRAALLPVAVVLPLAAVGRRLGTSWRRGRRGDLALRHRRGLLRATISPVAALFASALRTLDARRR
jgi:hypothetical protein